MKSRGTRRRDGHLDASERDKAPRLVVFVDRKFLLAKVGDGRLINKVGSAGRDTPRILEAAETVNDNGSMISLLMNAPGCGGACMDIGLLVTFSDRPRGSRSQRRRLVGEPGDPDCVKCAFTDDGESSRLWERSRTARV